MEVLILIFTANVYNSTPNTHRRERFTFFFTMRFASTLPYMYHAACGLNHVHNVLRDLTETGNAPLGSHVDPPTVVWLALRAAA